LLLLLYLHLLALSVFARDPDNKSGQQTKRLYQVTKWEDRAGRKRIGFIDNTGKLIIGFDRLPLATEYVGDFCEGRALIEFNEKYDPAGSRNTRVGFIDESGNIIIAPRFRLARNFNEGRAYVEAQEGYGFIDLDGKLVIKTGDRARDFHEGMAAVFSSADGGQWGYSDRFGKMVVGYQYQFAADFSEGLAGVLVDKKFGFINLKGKMIIAPRFAPRFGPYAWSPVVDTSRFSEGLAPVTTDDANHPTFDMDI
jgi:hypothetical protein